MESKLARLVKRIRDTQVEEIDCSTCLEQISEYVDFELAREDVAERMPQVTQHLGQCGVCFDEYQVLRDLARLEGEGNTPSRDELADRLTRPPE